jgi:diguanylate cyclase (GGDEF)-like protein
MHVLVRSGLVAAASIVASITISAIVVPGDEFLVADGMALIMCIVCPLVIAWPASAYTFWQKERLAAALAEVKRTHAELAAAHRLLAEKARRDPMTGMLNREAFFEEMECARRAYGRGTLLIVDADNFKRVNDTWGHLTGDAALLEIGAALKRAVRADDVAGRVGGEEFAVFLADADLHESMLAAERIRAEVAALRFSPRAGETLPLSVSIGAAIHRGGAALSDLMREADRRLYEAKRRGRNRVIFGEVGLAA